MYMSQGPGSQALPPPMGSPRPVSSHFEGFPYLLSTHGLSRAAVQFATDLTNWAQHSRVLYNYLAIQSHNAFGHS